MKRYLLDTNICIYFLRNRFDIDKRIATVGWNNCCISEITVAELLYGAERSNDVEKNVRLVEEFCNCIDTIPIKEVLTVYARQKVILRKKGTPIDDLDLFIGATAVAYQYIMVTENIRHLDRLDGIQIENWVKR